MKSIIAKLFPKDDNKKFIVLGCCFGATCLVVFLFLRFNFDVQLIFDKMVGTFVRIFTWQRIVKALSFVFVVWFCEFLFVGWKNSTFYKMFPLTKTTGRDLIYFIINRTSLDAYILNLITLGFYFYLTHLLNFQFNPIQQLGPPIVQFFAYLIIFDFFVYVMHYLQHRVPFMWELHKVHHSGTEMNIITNDRNHILERVTSELIWFVPMALIGTPAETFFVLLYIKELLTFFSHSQVVYWNFGWIGKYILYPPVLHFFHHSIHHKHAGKNLGTTFVWWDRMFGTYYYSEQLPTEIGIKDNYFNQKSFFYDVIEPARRAGLRLVKMIKR